MHKIKIYNSLSNKKEDFIPIDNNNIRLYACGPTVYDYAHIGNARMAVVFDVLVRMLRYFYPKVTYVSNITDIDDKIIIRSAKEKVDFFQITKKYEEIYNRDMKSLNVLKPDKQPRATKYVNQMIEKIDNLCKKEIAYNVDNHVVFNVSKFSRYGELSKNILNKKIAGKRIKVESYKKNPDDFVLWKPSKKNEPGWQSPWGFGRPGWHTECFVMCEEILGTPFDIHGGGLDLKFPHHENEIAQSCCYNNLDDVKGFARYWVHNGFVEINSKKMSKSLQNVRLVKDFLSHYDGEIVRLALLSAHYRSPLNWNKNILDQSKNIMTKYYSVLEKLSELDVDVSNEIRLEKKLEDAISDDLNLSKTFSILNSKISDFSQTVSLKEKKELKQQLLIIGKILGLFQKNPKQWKSKKKIDIILDENKINGLIKERNIARKTGQYSLADDIREKLLQMGVEISDNKSGTDWRKIDD